MNNTLLYYNKRQNKFYVTDDLPSGVFTSLNDALCDIDSWFYDDFSRIVSRCCAEIRYENKYLFDLNGKSKTDVCRRCDSTIPQDITRKIEFRVIKVYMERLKQIIIHGVNSCKICSGINHKPFSKQCLLYSKKYKKLYQESMKQKEINVDHINTLMEMIDRVEHKTSTIELMMKKFNEIVNPTQVLN